MLLSLKWQPYLQMTLFGTQCLYIEVCDWEIAKESSPLGPRFQLISSLALSKSKRRENDVFYKLKRKELALFIVLKFYGNFMEIFLKESQLMLFLYENNYSVHYL